MNFALEDTKLSKGHQRIADYIAKNPENIPFMVEEDLAQACGVSTSTVSRFWGEIGYRNLREFKQQAKEEWLLSPSIKLQSAFGKLEEAGTAASGVLQLTEYLQKTAERLDQAAFEQAVTVLHEASTIYLYGPGSAVCLTALMEFRLSRFGANVKTFSRGGHELLNTLIHVGPSDVIVIFGFVSQSPEMKALLEYAADCGCKTLLVTDLAVNDMLDQADILLYTERGELWEFHSMTAPIALIETLVVAVGKMQEHSALENGEKLHELRRKFKHLLPKRV
ncbi:MurR/RpiR family transcriptional regulator [Paenibacillus hexagrammi]|uniref:MurR/RpiR family transcriptional regulator n=1 Tax=Paenibacillus hexagrammi TaxID=2908839 RepID=A0ABY3SIR8_9BACL|nr:MurR/RpiR family transcriptional regulator [Paenibacillus sp. YPD9-1]UJF33031.1 MurR/RpiR family transcriptional regulator [Paenibacillus sp. YPD9-1]